MTVTRLDERRVPRRDGRRRRRRRSRLAAAASGPTTSGPTSSSRDASEELAVIGLWGPAARRGARGRDRATTSRDEALPSVRGANSHRAGAGVWHSGSRYVGELGYELYVPPEWADAGVGSAARGGRAHGIEPCRLPRASTRCGWRRAIRYFGTDLTALDTPVRGRSGLLRRARAEGRLPRPGGAQAERARRRRAQAPHALDRASGALL